MVRTRFPNLSWLTQFGTFRYHLLWAPQSFKYEGVRVVAIRNTGYKA